MAQSRHSKRSRVLSSLEVLSHIYKKYDDVTINKVRIATTQILQQVAVQDKACREVANKTNQGIEILIHTLEATDDFCIIANIITIFHELLQSKSAKQHRCKLLVLHGGTKAIFQSLLSLSKMNPLNKGIMIKCHLVLADIAKKDRKFGLKARITGALQVTLNMLKSHQNNMKLLHSILLVLKYTCLNGVNCTVLGRENIVTILLQLLKSAHINSISQQKLVLEILVSLTKAKCNINQAIKIGVIPFLISKMEHKSCLNIQKSVLSILRNLTTLNSGIKAFTEANGITQIYSYCQHIADKKEMGFLISTCAIVLRRCFSNISLPISTCYSCITFDLTHNECHSFKAMKIEESSAKISEVQYNQVGHLSGEKDNCDKNQLIFHPDVPYSCALSCGSEYKNVNVSKMRMESFCSRNTFSMSQIEECLKDSEQSKNQEICCFDDYSSCHETYSLILNKLLNECQEYNKQSDHVIPNYTPQLYQHIANQTKRVNYFVKLAYPDIHPGPSSHLMEPLNQKKITTQRTKILQYLDQCIPPDQLIDIDVYDLESLASKNQLEAEQRLTNNDEAEVGESYSTKSLIFESRFESGNLRKAIQIRQYEYNLILNADINTNRHHQWFYFEVRNMEANVTYRFNIINCEKNNSQYNFGMQVLVYSVWEAVFGHPGWIRSGTDIHYYKNFFTQISDVEEPSNYFTLSFNMTFPHSKDICYLAYHYPYTYSTLQSQLLLWQHLYDKKRILFQVQNLTPTLGGNHVDLLTITATQQKNSQQYPIDIRPYIFLTSRVHPGETNASWIMKGVIQFLLGNSSFAQTLRSMYIFKIVPMLNPEGVINGCHRCSLSGEDLNRQWCTPCPRLHPEVFHTKGMLYTMSLINRTPLVFCDFHGHSRRKNVFFYGCSPTFMHLSENEEAHDSTMYKVLPLILDKIAPAFSFNSCNFNVEKSKETTARVVVWRQFRVARSYTMESTYSGCDQGPYKGLQMGLNQYEEMGQKFCEALLIMNAAQDQDILHAPGGSNEKLSSAELLDYFRSSTNVDVKKDPETAY